MGPLGIAFAQALAWCTALQEDPVEGWSAPGYALTYEMYVAVCVYIYIYI